jgi:hypothetical protein
MSAAILLHSIPQWYYFLSQFSASKWGGPKDSLGAKAQKLKIILFIFTRYIKPLLTVNLSRSDAIRYKY